MRQFDAKLRVDAGYESAHWYDAVGFCRWLGRHLGLPEGDQAYAAPEDLDKAKYPREPNPEASWAPRNWPLELGRRGFRLPTESEWEVASGAGARTPYGFGGEVSLLGRFGWFLENSGKHGHPPRELRPNIRGLFDLHGNLFEWVCIDWYGDFGETAAVDSLGAKEGSTRVNRGGSWIFDAASCRTAYRNMIDPSRRTNDVGFRLALSLSGVTPEAASVKGAEPSGRHGGSVRGAATGDAVAGWRSGFVARKQNARVQGVSPRLRDSFRMPAGPTAWVCGSFWSRYTIQVTSSRNSTGFWRGTRLCRSTDT